MNLGILLWNTCNAKCRHCAVDSSPTEVGYMSDEQIFALIDAAFYDGKPPNIGLSGGEAFLYFDRLCRIAQYATDRGARIAINTNGFWGTTVDKASEKLRRLKSIGVSKLVVSIDDFHEEYIPRERVLNVFRACKIVHFEVELQYVSTRSSKRLADFLKEHGDVLLNITCREIPCHPVGRAAHIPASELFTEPGVPEGLCPSAIPSVSAYGKVIPCCNTAGHLPALQLGTIDEPLEKVHGRFLFDPVMRAMLKGGPRALLPAAIEAGYTPSPAGYVDQCHLCYEIFKDPRIAAAVRKAATARLAEEIYAQFAANYAEVTGAPEAGTLPRPLACAGPAASAPAPEPGSRRPPLS